MDKNSLIEKYADTIEEHFKEHLHAGIPIVIPYINREYLKLIPSGTFQAAPPMFERMEVTWYDWQNFLKRKEYDVSFEELLK